MKRLLATICFTLSLFGLVGTASPQTVIAAEQTPAIEQDQPADDPSDLSALVEQSIERDMVTCTQREADIISIRAQYEGSVEIDMLAKLIYREARGVKSDTEKAAVVWCVLNRVDDSHHPDTIKKVITQKHQFAWRPKTPVQQKFKDLALDVVIRWELEKRGYENAGRILPSDYLFFAGRRGHNWFRNKYRTRRYWDWSLYSPYESGETLLGNYRINDGSIARAYAQTETASACISPKSDGGAAYRPFPFDGIPWRNASAWHTLMITPAQIRQSDWIRASLTPRAAACQANPPSCAYRYSRQAFAAVPRYRKMVYT